MPCKGSPADYFVVLSNDSDLLMPIRLVKEELGRNIGVLSPLDVRRSSNELRRLDLGLSGVVTHCGDADCCPR